MKLKKPKLSTRFWETKTQQEWRTNCKTLMEATLVMLLVIGAYAIYNQITFLLIASIAFTTIPTLTLITYHKWTREQKQENNKEKDTQGKQ